jgi:hypothetical protein
MFGQQTRLAGPVSGLVFDDYSRSLRWIVGVPGAAYLGGSVAEGLEIAAVAPNSKLALAVKDGALFLIRLGGDEAVWETLEAEAGAVDRIVWSADSSAAIVSGAALRIWRNLGATAEALALAGADGSKWLALVLEGGGEAALAAKAGGVYRLSGSEARLVAAVEDPSALAIAPAGDVAYVADRAGKQLLALRNWKDSGEVSLIAGESQGIDDPVAVAIGSDARSVLLAGGTSRSLIQIDPASGALTARWDLDFQPTRIERLSSGLFGLTRRTGGAEPLQVITAGPQPSVFFVPAGAALSGDSGSQE